ncbi:MAG: DUF1385 domain-containing protein [Thermanaeromonas sp.]|uniref:DUF1385 domain-containing protein n=1 Tax=Thermanaeromonas sp. TaxID=2003697 RepID=UPI00243ECC21|nr:DUF1385 domain-containing protein [Thermanaeromonas sp.]MCG0277034.1 DUF1385 domain-containing protein [Thermanaeromonas sp.]
MPEVQFGGQAVIEGVMMRGPHRLAVAIRRPAGDILVEARPFSSWASRHRLLRLPFFRGVVALVESLVLGIKYLSLSAGVALEEEGEELRPRDLILTVALALVVATGIFVVIPAVLAMLTHVWLPFYGQSLLEGFLRLALFLGYIAAISQVKDIQRVFQYHGAEHKVINALEAGEELTVERIRPYSTLHPRCGTSFLLLVVLLSVFFFSFLGKGGIWWRLFSRIALLPVVAGSAYEVIKWASRHMGSPVVRLVVAPGLWLQKFTTREPDDEMLEVALKALLAAKGEASAGEVVRC